jgi:hypothetical protein
MLQVYRSAHPVVPTDTQMLVLCTRLEKLMKVLARASEFNPKTHPKRIRRQAMWMHVASLLDISWDKGMEPVYCSWERCRNPLAHGDPEVFASMKYDEAFRHIFRLQGGFNALLAGIFRCHTIIRISPMETELEARIRFTVRVMSDQEWERRIVTTLNAVTVDKAGDSADPDLDK